MLRCLALFLIAGYVLLPPGICACRLQAFVFSLEHAHEENGNCPAPVPEEEDHCTCSEESGEFVTAQVPELQGGTLKNLMVSEVTPIVSPSTLSLAASLTPHSFAHAPLYVALRALLI